MAFAALSIGVYALRPPLGLSIGTLIPLLVGAGWVAAPFVSSRKTAHTIKRTGAAAAYLAAVAAVFAAGLWAYRADSGRPRGESEQMLAYMLVPLLQAITLTIAGAMAKSGERPLRPRPQQQGSATTPDPKGAERARDEPDQEGAPPGRHIRDP